MTKEDFNHQTIIGIDPGASGGIVTWRPNQLTMAIRTPKDFVALCDYLKYIKSISENPLVFMEKVQMYHSDSKGEAGSTGYGKQFGIAKMLAQYEGLKNALRIVGIPYIPVFPITWQSYLNLRRRDDKDKTARKGRYKDDAQHLYKDLKVTLWSSDALLLVEFGRRKIEYDFDWIIKNYPVEMLNKAKLM